MIRAWRRIRSAFPCRVCYYTNHLLLITYLAYRERKQSTSVDPDQPVEEEKVDEQVVEEEVKEPTEPNPDANDIPQLEFSTDEGSVC